MTRPIRVMEVTWQSVPWARLRRNSTMCAKVCHGRSASVKAGISILAAKDRRFDVWVRRCLAPKLRRGDVVVLDNLWAHKRPHIRELIEARGARLQFLPPYSPDLNPIEAAWGLIKKRIRSVAPRSGSALRRTAQRAWRVIRPRHCQNWYAHAGYCWQLK